MERILAELGEIAEKIKTLEDKRIKLGQFLREIKGVQISPDKKVLEDKVAISVEPDSLESRKIIGVDGGLVKKSFHAVDLILTKAVGAVFEYERGNLLNIGYIPSSLPTPRLTVITDPYSERDFSYSSNLERMITEAQVLLESTKENPDMLIADGSIVPHSSDKPSKDSDAYSRYLYLIQYYKEIFKNNGGLLAGVIEDSRAKSFSEIISDKILSQVKSPTIEELKSILSRTRDTNLLFHVLKENERSFVFRYSENPEQHPVLRDFEEFGKCIYSFYLKTAKYDRPVRVDFYTKSDPIQTADQIASILLSISSHNQEYGIPVPIIEADARAKLKEEELSIIHSHIVDRVGDLPSLFRLRRDERPF